MANAPQEPKRRGTLRDLKTAVTARIRSKPTIEGQRYLDLYVLQRDRFRWLRLIRQAERAIQGIDMALRKIGFAEECDELEPDKGETATSGRGDAGKTGGAAAKRTNAA